MRLGIALGFALAAAVTPLAAQITLVNPEGKEARCDAKEEPSNPQQLPAPQDYGALGALQATYDAHRISPPEYCARRYELAGYWRRASGPAARTAQTYANPVYLWSVSYPAEWKIDASNPASVILFAPGNAGRCGIHSTRARPATVDEYADYMRGFNEKYFEEQGVKLWTTPKRPVPLANGVAGVEMITDLSNGGRSRRIYVVLAPMAHVVDCEAFTGAWEKLEPLFARIIDSVTFRKL